MECTTRRALLRAAEEAREASSIQAAVTAARQVLGIAGAATYTEDLAAILRATADAAGQVADREEDGFIDRLREAAVADEPVELWGRDYLSFLKGVPDELQR